MNPGEDQIIEKPTSWLTSLLETLDKNEKQIILKKVVYKFKQDRLDEKLNIRKLNLKKRWEDMQIGQVDH